MRIKVPSPLSQEERKRAFTLVEVLVAVTVLGVLVALGSGACRGAIRRAQAAEDIAASRRLIQAYLDAATDGNGVLPKGRYAEDEVPEVIMPDRAKLSTLTAKVVLQRYPWQLARYLNWNVEKTLLTWVNRKQFKDGIAQLSSIPAMSKYQYYYGLSVSPAFGQNAFGVGGYERSTQSEAATRLASVVSPSKLIAFLSAKDNTLNGYSYVEPPKSVKLTLRFDGTVDATPLEWAKGSYALDQAQSFGYIALHHNGKAVATFLDGHTELLGLEELRDSRYWSHLAQEKNDPSHAVAR